MFKTIAVAVSMYSAVPMPQFQWSEKNMRYAMVAFPLVGALCGIGLLLWYYLCSFLNFGCLLQGAGLVLVPVLITGGIHLDGFCDTTDAIASHADRERKLEIMKDSHAGAFAIIGVVAYLLFYVAVSSELVLTLQTVGALALIHVYSRCLSGFSVATVDAAKKSGLVYAFQDGAARSRVAVVLGCYLVVLAILFLWLMGISGLIPLGTGLLMFLIYVAYSKHTFGGITGDLAGWFLSLAELLMVFSLVLGAGLV